METQTMTVAQIEAQLSAARERLGQLDGEAKELALPAVNGDQEAVNKLATVNASIKRVTADIAILANAKLTAARKKAEADVEADAEQRAQHMEAARERAQDIVRFAAQADELVASYKVLIASISEAESEVGRSLGSAGQPVDTTIVGRRDLSRFMVERMMVAANGNDKFLLEKRPIAEIAASAWADLLENGVASDE